MSAAPNRLAARLRRVGAGRARLGVVAGLVAFAVLAGTSASYAYFQVTAQATGSASAGTLAVSATNLTSAAYTFRNDALDTVGSFTVTNTSDSPDGIARTATITLNATGDATALGAIRYILTAKGSAACAAKNTVSGSTLTENTVGTVWSTAATLTPSLAPGASVTYCLESYIRTAASMASSSGSRSITPSVTASLGAGSWTATTAATTTEASQAIYPAYTSMTTDWSYVRPADVSGTHYCFDVSGAADANDTHVISWPCKSAGTINQTWKFVADTGYYSLQPQNAQTRVAQAMGAGSGSLIYTETASTATTQDWQVQQVSTGLYQFVNRSTGLCASATTASGDLTLQPCTDAAATQRFVVSPYISANPTCTTSGLTQTSFTLGWTTNNPGPFKIYVGGTLVQTQAGRTITLGPYTSTQSVVITDSSSSFSAAAGDTVLATATLTPGLLPALSSCTTSNLVN